MSDRLKQIQEERHQESMKDPVYAAGFNAKSLNECPYAYPQDKCQARRELAAKDRLTEKDKVELKRANEEFDQTEWARWSDGYYTMRFMNETHFEFVACNKQGVMLAQGFWRHDNSDVMSARRTIANVYKTTYGKVSVVKLDEKKEDIFITGSTGGFYPSL